MAAALYGHEVVSDLPLERLREGPAPRGRLTIRAATELPDPPSGEPSFAVGDHFAVHRHGGRLTVWCRSTGTYEIDPAAGELLARPRDGAGFLFEHRLACIVIPLMLAERGDLSLHASAVAAAGRAVAFAAPSGRGKSTLAAALAERGHEVLAEDGCVVTAGPEGPRLWPGLRGVRLAGRFVPHGESAEPVPLAAVVLLGPRRGTHAAVEPVPAVEALTKLMPSTMHALGASQAAAFRGAAHAARSVAVVRATMPDDLAAAPAHAESLLRAVLDLARSTEACAARPT